MTQLLCRFTSILFLQILFIQCVSGQYNPTYNNEVEEKIKLVEKNLYNHLRIDTLTQTLSQQMEKYKIPGVSIAVIKNNKLEWARGYGYADKEAKIPVTVQTLFQAASISKSLNAVGVMKLVQEEKLNLDNDINSFLSSWKFPYDSSKGKKTITIKHLLSHTAGLNRLGFRGYNPSSKLPNIVQILTGASPARNCRIKSIADAGSQHRYSNGGISITQLIVSDITKTPYDQYMKKEVLNKLNMMESFYTTPPPIDKIKFLATGYNKKRHVKGKYRIYPDQAPSSLWTNPTELSNYIIEMQLAFAGKSEKVLNSQSVQKMFTHVMGGSALGVFLERKDSIEYFIHSGSTHGFKSVYIASVEEGNGAIVMVNSNNGKILDEIVNSISVLYGWKHSLKVFPKVVDVPAAILRSYTGVYKIDPNFSIRVRKKGDVLFAQGTDQGAFPIYPEGTNKFFSKVGGIQIEFVKNTNGKVSKMVLIQDAFSDDYIKRK